MGTLTGTVVSVHAGGNSDLSKEVRDFITVELDGIVDVYEHQSGLVRSTD